VAVTVRNKNPMLCERRVAFGLPAVNAYQNKAEQVFESQLNGRITSGQGVEKVIWNRGLWFVLILDGGVGRSNSWVLIYIRNAEKPAFLIPYSVLNVIIKQHLKLDKELVLIAQLNMIRISAQKPHLTLSDIEFLR